MSYRVLTNVIYNVEELKDRLKRFKKEGCSNCKDVLLLLEDKSYLVDIEFPLFLIKNMDSDFVILFDQVSALDLKTNKLDEYYPKYSKYLVENKENLLNRF